MPLARDRLLQCIGVALFCLAPGLTALSNPASSNGIASITALNPADSIEQQLGYIPLRCAFHVHSRFSNGEFEIAQLAAFASQRQIDVLGISDSFLTRVRYGVSPWRKLFSYVKSRPAVRDHGGDKYLAIIREAQRQYPDMVLLAGLEVTPSYYWQGTFPNLQLYDFDRHRLVFGLEEEAIIRNLPVIENETWANTPKNWGLAVGPIACFLTAFFLFALALGKKIHLVRFAMRTGRRFWALSFSLLAIGVGWAYEEYPLGSLADPYSGKPDTASDQRLVDYVRQHGGLIFCSYPEARYPDVEVLGARMISRAHIEDLWRLKEYTGFEGIYGDRITATDPGNAWDRVLLDYLQQGRQLWPSAITGIDFHHFSNQSGWYELDRGQTILWAKSKERTAVLEALRAGRGYAVFQGAAGRELLLRNFAVRSEDQLALCGETLKTASPVTFITALVDWNRSFLEDGDAGLARIELVRDGSLLEKQDLKLPILIRRSEKLAVGNHYYRLRVTVKGYELLSNPVFVQVR